MRHATFSAFHAHLNLKQAEPFLLLQDADPIFVDAKTDDTSSDNDVKSTVLQEYEEPLNSHNNSDTIGETTTIPSTDTSGDKLSSHGGV